jgi:hypothetical protein
MRSEGTTLNAACSSQYGHITELFINQQQPESQQLLPVAALAPTNPVEWVA